MSENEKKVPTVVVKRLPRYYRYLGELLKQDIKRISSNALSVKMNVTASDRILTISAVSVSRDTAIMSNIFITKSVTY